MVSSFGSLHSSVLANSRIPFAMARDGLFFRGLAKLSPRSKVPIRAILAQAAWGSVLALSGSYDTLTDSVVFVAWVFYGLSIASLFVFRRTMPNASRPYRALGLPGRTPGLSFVTVALLVNTFFAAPRQALQESRSCSRACPSIGGGRGTRCLFRPSTPSARCGAARVDCCRPRAHPIQAKAEAHAD